MAETELRDALAPDDSVSSHYCPSHVVKKYLKAGERYPVADFVRISREALEMASERVRENFGYPCGRAFAAIRDIERKASAIADATGGEVEVVAFDDF